MVMRGFIAGKLLRLAWPSPSWRHGEPDRRRALTLAAAAHERGEDEQNEREDERWWGARLLAATGAAVGVAVRLLVGRRVRVAAIHTHARRVGAYVLRAARAARWWRRADRERVERVGVVFGAG